MLAPQDDVMRRPPRSATAPLLSAKDFWAIGRDGVSIGSSTMAAHLYALGRYGPGPKTRAITFSSLVLAQLAYAYTCRGDENGGTAAPPMFASAPLNAAMAASLGIQALPIFVPAIQRMLGIAPLSWSDVPAVITSAMMPSLVREAGRLWRLPV
jgi:Ca2+-transporting ATPase